MPPESLSNPELLNLLHGVRRLMGQGFSQAQAFEIAISRAGWVGRMTYGAFTSAVGRHAAQNFPGAGQLPALSAAVQAMAPAVAGGAAWFRFQAQMAGARVLGRLAPRAGAVVLGAGAFSLPGILAGAAVLAALGGGIYMASNWGKPDAQPVAAGERMATAYVPIRVNGNGGSGGILSVRTAGAIDQGIPSARFRHGGIGTEPARIETLGPPMSIEEATAHLARMITPGSLRRPPLADGFVADVGGVSTTIDDWGSIDFSLLRALLDP